MKFSISVPNGYASGAYFIEASLEGNEIAAYKNWPRSFPIPNKPKRLIHTKPEFLIAASTESGTQLQGIFSNGRWISDVYSNGVSEDKNPTKIEVIEKELKSFIEAAISESLSMQEAVKNITK